MLGNEGSHSSKDAMQSISPNPTRVRSTNEVRCKRKPHHTSYMRTVCNKFSFWPTFSYEDHWQTFTAAQQGAVAKRPRPRHPGVARTRAQTRSPPSPPASW